MARSRMCNLPQVLLQHNSFDNEMVVLTNTLMFCPSLATQACFNWIYSLIRCSKSTHAYDLYTHVWISLKRQKWRFPSSCTSIFTLQMQSHSLAFFNNSWAVADQGYCLMTDCKDLANKWIFNPRGRGDSDKELEGIWSTNQVGTHGGTVERQENKYLSE